MTAQSHEGETGCRSRPRLLGQARAGVRGPRRARAEPPGRADQQGNQGADEARRRTDQERRVADAAPVRPSRQGAVKPPRKPPRRASSRREAATRRPAQAARAAATRPARLRQTRVRRRIGSACPGNRRCGSQDSGMPADASPAAHRNGPPDRIQRCRRASAPAGSGSRSPAAVLGGHLRARRPRRADRVPVGIDFNALDVYVGVSAGGFIAAGLANGNTPHQMVRMFIEGEKSRDRFEPSILLRPAFKRVRAAPGLGAAAAGRSRLLALRARRQHDDERVRAARPRDPDRHLRRRAGRRTWPACSREPGRTNDFRQLAHRSSSSPPTSTPASRSSSAPPGSTTCRSRGRCRRRPPCPACSRRSEIDGRYFVDGALNKTLHASVALERGRRPGAVREPAGALRRLAAPPHARHGHHLDSWSTAACRWCWRRPAARSSTRGWARAWSATRARTRTRTSCCSSRTGADADIFFTSIFSYSSRRRLCEHAYQKTRDDLLARRHELAPPFERHGIEIRTDVLRDRAMTLVKSLRRSRGLWREAASTAATRSLPHAGRPRALAARVRARRRPLTRGRATAAGSLRYSCRNPIRRRPPPTPWNASRRAAPASASSNCRCGCSTISANPTSPPR